MPISCVLSVRLAAGTMAPPSLAGNDRGAAQVLAALIRSP